MVNACGELLTTDHDERHRLYTYTQMCSLIDFARKQPESECILPTPDVVCEWLGKYLGQLSKEYMVAGSKHPVQRRLYSYTALCRLVDHVIPPAKAPQTAACYVHEWWVQYRESK